MATPTFERNDPNRNETPSRVTSSSATRVASPVVEPSSREMISILRPSTPRLPLISSSASCHPFRYGTVNAAQRAYELSSPILIGACWDWALVSDPPTASRVATQSPNTSPREIDAFAIKQNPFPAAYR